MKVYVSVPAGNQDFDYKYLATHSDGLILMDYDQHSGASAAGRSPARTGSLTTWRMSSSRCPRKS